ncbi:MAG: D-alanyl-D-alanine carboxypeptidase/D-alanyl-D-alanine-endopeptidase [Acidobacteria bacterium 13_1_20CM_3_53_8]|nr:MAG: D-alanyl-D-alanine carboxypeptidase/D-alanyl-D-alanine-endopeptidase [Acidobacteria bacterium 13_1_20CM_3_53_8]
MDSAAAVELGHTIDHLIDESEFASARWGVYVMRLSDGRALYARNADRLITPASNMKLYTTGVALDLLGAGYRWRTSVYAGSQPDAKGTISGDLTLYGRGSPDLASYNSRNTNDSLGQLADELYKRGVRRVRGAIVGDESYFKGEPLGDGWLWNDVQWYFGAEVSALTVNNNEINITVTPAAKAGDQAVVKLNLPGGYFQVKNDTETIERSKLMTVGVTRGLSDNQVRVWGEFPTGGHSITARLSVHQPALWAAEIFRDELKAHGIAVDGAARTVDARVPDEERIDAGRAVEIASIESSRTLGEVVRATNKESINLNAELMLRTLGRERGAQAPDPNPRRNETRGDDEAGVAVVLQWLQQKGISTEGFTLHDGSGLSRLDLITPQATALLLAAMTKSPAADAYRDSLPVAGRDGTLESRLRKVAPGSILAKTGTLSYDNSLSGYALTADNEWLAFAIFCNDETQRTSSTHVIDDIAALLTTYHSQH